MKISASKRDSAGVPWRLGSDLDLIVVQKRITPICKYLHELATVQGLAEVTIHSHELTPRLRAPDFWIYLEILWPHLACSLREIRLDHSCQILL